MREVYHTNFCACVPFFKAGTTTWVSYCVQVTGKREGHSHEVHISYLMFLR